MRVFEDHERSTKQRMNKRRRLVTQTTHTHTLSLSLSTQSSSLRDLSARGDNFQFVIVVRHPMRRVTTGFDRDLSPVNEWLRCHCSSSDARCGGCDNKCRLMSTTMMGRGRMQTGQKRGERDGKKREKSARARQRDDFVIAHFLRRCH